MLFAAVRFAAVFSAALASSTLSVASRGGPPAAALTVRVPEPAVDVPLAQHAGRQTAVLAGGCFWGLQAVFEHVKGVISVTSGYSGGKSNTASYDEVSTGTTGHAESVQIVYDPSQISYGQLLKVFFSVAHDPTELDRQGPDEGPQYRSNIFVSSDEQRRIAEAYIGQIGQAQAFPQPIVTKVTTLSGFYPAEAYHQDYFIHHPTAPYIVINDKPKVEHLRTEWPTLYRDAVTS
jgi:peptide-methionine (S)-S-oxide reductase